MVEEDTPYKDALALESLVDLLKTEFDFTKVKVLTHEERRNKENKLLQRTYDTNRRAVKSAGNYLIGPILGSSPVRSMVQCLGRKKGTDEFYALKILTVRDSNSESQDDRQGKMLLHTEHSLLSFLDGQPGILKQYGLFQDYAYMPSVFDEEEKLTPLEKAEKLVRRLVLVLDCVHHHDYDPCSSDYINLQHYVIAKRKLSELDAFTIFYNIVSVVKNLHELNVIHRDIKLANLVLNQRTRQITLVNFCLGQHLVSEKDPLQDQRGSPAYISPDVLFGKPYLGKPSDMWALGVLFFTMLFGQFPFYNKYHQELFKLIKTANYKYPSDIVIKPETRDIINGLLTLEPLNRLTANEVLIQLTSLITLCLSPERIALFDDHVVPEKHSEEETAKRSNGRLKRILTLRTAPADDDNESSQNDLDYYIQKSISHVPESAKEKRGGTHGIKGSSAREMKVTGSSPSMSIIEGDLRTFAQADLFLHRNIFPPYNGPDLVGWTTARTVSSSSSTTTTTSTPRRTPSTTAPLRLPSFEMPPVNAPHNIYEFPPPRRWALAVLQKLNNGSERPPSVPQLELDGAGPSTSGLSRPSTSGESPLDNPEGGRPPKMLKTDRHRPPLALLRLRNRRKGILMRAANVSTSADSVFRVRSASEGSNRPATQPPQQVPRAASQGEAIPSLTPQLPSEPQSGAAGPPTAPPPQPQFVDINSPSSSDIDMDSSVDRSFDDNNNLTDD